MCRPTLVEPTKLTPLIAGRRSRISASLRLVVTRLSTPAGRPACRQSSVMRMTDCGTKLAAFSTMQLPAATQMGAIQPCGIMAGKFQGAMPAKTPTGWL